MSSVDLGGGRPKKQAKGGLKRPKHRLGVRIDMTPMVDIAFLLLIFYMVTTIFSAPLSMEISLPPKDEIGQKQDIIKIKESKLLLMYVDETDSVFYQIGENMHQPLMVSPQELVKTIDDKNRNIQGLVMVLKLDPKASYKMMVNIIDAIQGVERSMNAALEQAAAPGTTPERYSVKFSLQDMNALDQQVLGIVKAGGTVEE